jgi:alpha-D-xyloside xylohydrolase
MDFREDEIAVKQAYEFMFGKNILVAPITDAGVNEWNVYLPKSVNWYDFWTGKRFTGGQTVKTAAPLDNIPLFVKAGSIIPMGKFIQYAGEKSADTLEIRVYKGANGKFDLFEDEGDNYNYEKGKYSTILFSWDEKSQTLTIGDKLGNFPNYLAKRVFNIVFVNESEGFGILNTPLKKSVLYTGKGIKIKL